MSQEEIDALRTSLLNEVRIGPRADLAVGVGSRVRIKNGPLAGVKGNPVKRKTGSAG